MHDNVHDLFTEDLSDEAAYYLCNFFYDLALAFESSHHGEIMRHQKSQVELRDKITYQNRFQGKASKEKLQDPPF